ncbi:hypothetical protein GGI35DRAFT_26237 [Trichoderma velutinum]
MSFDMPGTYQAASSCVIAALSCLVLPLARDTRDESYGGILGCVKRVYAMDSTGDYGRGDEEEERGHDAIKCRHQLHTRTCLFRVFLFLLFAFKPSHVSGACLWFFFSFPIRILPWMSRLAGHFAFHAAEYPNEDQDKGKIRLNKNVEQFLQKNRYREMTWQDGNRLMPKLKLSWLLAAASRAHLLLSRPSKAHLRTPRCASPSFSNASTWIARLISWSESTSAT